MDAPWGSLTCRECGSGYYPAEKEPCPSGWGPEDVHLPEEDLPPPDANLDELDDWLTA